MSILLPRAGFMAFRTLGKYFFLEFLSVQFDFKMSFKTNACNPSAWEAEAGAFQVPGGLGYRVRPCPTLPHQKKFNVNYHMR
jgi:hypothetical protein